ncbi:hypothetical protein GBA52_013331 [Prunus armeniaca]|nr:hypothetical protein GBA52_013331 [Prunus armeniaca]
MGWLTDPTHLDLGGPKPTIRGRSPTLSEKKPRLDRRPKTYYNAALRFSGQSGLNVHLSASATSALGTNWQIMAGTRDRFA